MKLTYCKLKAILVENDFRIKEINAKDILEKWRKLTQRSKRNEAFRDNKNKVKRIIQNGNFVCGTFPKHTKRAKRRHLPKIWEFFTVSVMLADLHPP